MKPYKILNCENLRDIQLETIDFVNKNYPDILKHRSLWHKTDTKKYLKECRELTKWCSSLKLLIREISFTVLIESTDVHIHVDELPVIAKINVPIMNTKHTINEWYEIPSKDYEQHKQVNEFGKYYYNFKDYDLKQASLLGQYELTQPIVFNSQIPHNVKTLPDAKFPRLVLSVMFHHDPINFLQ